MDSRKEILIVDRVSKSYGHNEILREVSLEVRSGEVVCLLGRSGSGKSTLLRCVNHLEVIDAGEIYVQGELLGYRRDGHDLYELPEDVISRQRAVVGMVFQNFDLFSHMTVMENLILAPCNVKRVPRKQAEAEAMVLLERVGLADRAGSYPRQLSGGQQQRIAIARALAMKPSLMLFDEPTSALDPELVGDVLNVMKELAADGMTMLVVTHEIGFAREVADRVAFMADGQVVESGPARELLENPTHAKTQAFLERIL
ncbi:amino acid ABC transporter ATP-binding protein [Amycolatopsis jejuensis]|uniref:amino acid ABC transporter ATP-binding protein n=1 Tax=Amycolatopsis jejuensis TaxID=330084 RepID=UPI00068B29B6|nr:amino acid ABC transporter ATP-binding protein [Amycolatopsis jejuensis]